MAYCIVNTDSMTGTKDPAKLVSLRCVDPVENGNVLVIGSIMEGEREIYEGTKPTGSETLKQIVLVATPEVMYDERKKNLNEFRNEPDGQPIRGYMMESGDRFSISAEGFEGTPEVGAKVTLSAGYKFAVAGSGTEIGEITDVYGVLYGIRVR